MCAWQTSQTCDSKDSHCSQSYTSSSHQNRSEKNIELFRSQTAAYIVSECMQLTQAKNAKRLRKINHVNGSLVVELFDNC